MYSISPGSFGASLFSDPCMALSERFHLKVNVKVKRVNSRLSAVHENHVYVTLNQDLLKKI
jgi:tRNA G26 N,N-dimethylase Trm1